jgi:drug/metabolite transporter (DMT)-like permease
VVVVIEYLVYGKTVSKRILASIAILLVGITLCTVTDAEVKSNVQGIMAAGAAVLVASLYQARGRGRARAVRVCRRGAFLQPIRGAAVQGACKAAGAAPRPLPPKQWQQQAGCHTANPPQRLTRPAAALAPAAPPPRPQIWAGTKQKELGLNGMQLLQQVSPVSVVLLAILIPLMEPIGWGDPRPGTILGYVFSTRAVMWILISSALGLVVTLSTFLFIGATDSLTYNVVGHLKTVLIVAAGVFQFGESMGLKKTVGLVVALTGIVWYTQIKVGRGAAGVGLWGCWRQASGLQGLGRQRRGGGGARACPDCVSGGAAARGTRPRLTRAPRARWPRPVRPPPLPGRWRRARSRRRRTARGSRPRQRAPSPRRGSHAARASGRAARAPARPARPLAPGRAGAASFFPLHCSPARHPHVLAAVCWCSPAWPECIRIPSP